MAIALLTIRSSRLCLLLIRRRTRPDKGKWALPAGFVTLGRGSFGNGEDLDQAADRELAELTGLDVFRGYREQLKTYVGSSRDRRVRTFSTAYIGVMPDLPIPRRSANAADAQDFTIDELDSSEVPELVYDHAQIIRDALERVRGKVQYEGRMAASFLTQPFTIPDLRRVYEAVWGCPIHRGDFRRKVLSVEGFLVAIGEVNTDTGGPPADLYRLGPAAKFHPPMFRDAMLNRKRDDHS